MCDIIIENLENDIVDFRNTHHTRVQVHKNEVVHGYRGTCNKVLQCIKVEVSNKSRISQANAILTKENHKIKIDKLREEAISKENNKTPPFLFESELRGIPKFPDSIINRLVYFGISKWEDICNWDKSNILPLSVIW
jgi:hypothetical protein